MKINSRKAVLKVFVEVGIPLDAEVLRPLGKTFQNGLGECSRTGAELDHDVA